MLRQTLSCENSKSAWKMCSIFGAASLLLQFRIAVGQSLMKWKTPATTTATTTVTATTTATPATNCNNNKWGAFNLFIWNLLLDKESSIEAERERVRSSGKGSGRAAEAAAATEGQRQRQSDSNNVEAVEFWPKLFCFFRRAALVVVVALFVVVLLLVVAALFVVVVVAVFSRCKMFGCGACEMYFFPSAMLEIYCLFMMPLSTLNCKFNRPHRCPRLSLSLLPSSSSSKCEQTPFIYAKWAYKTGVFIYWKTTVRLRSRLSVCTCKHWNCYKYAINLL